MSAYIPLYLVRIPYNVKIWHLHSHILKILKMFEKELSSSEAF